VGDVTFFYPSPRPNYVRAYIVGFNLPLTIINTSLSGNHLTFDTSDLVHHWDLRVLNDFLAATSNVYSIDHIFNDALSFHTISGVHSPSFLNIRVGFVPGEFELRVWVASEFTRDPNQNADLPPLSSYWLPRDL